MTQPIQIVLTSLICLIFATLAIKFVDKTCGPGFDNIPGWLTYPLTSMWLLSIVGVFAGFVAGIWS